MGNEGNGWQNILRDALRKDGMRAAAIVFAVFGLLLLALWLATNDGSSMSMFLALAGIGIIALAIMLYFFMPSRYLRDDVSDATAISSVLALNKVLSSMLVGTGGIYTNNNGLVRVFIPITPVTDIGTLSPGVEVFDVKGTAKGISLVPPGNGLFRLAAGMGGVFTREGLESEIKDVMENGMELASSVGVRQDGDNIMITLAGMANGGMCRSIRESDPDVCTRTGCPVCSFLACMAVAGTGQKVRIEKVEESDRVLNITLRLL